jgi:Na+-translocating ferredoxin:NAD+ oxidoreductase RnfD subunit
MEPHSVDRTRPWLLTVVAALAALAFVHIMFGGSWAWPAIYAALFLPLLLLVYVDLRRRREAAVPSEERFLDREEAKAEASRWRRWSIPIVIVAVIVGGLLAGAGPSSIPILVIVGLVLVAIRGAVGWLFDRVT